MKMDDYHQLRMQRDPEYRAAVEELERAEQAAEKLAAELDASTPDWRTWRCAECGSALHPHEARRRIMEQHDQPNKYTGLCDDCTYLKLGLR